MAELNEEYVPTLTLDPSAAPTAAAVSPEDEEKLRDENAVKLDLNQLSDAEQKAVLDFSQKIDITDTNTVLQYGASSQKNIADFSSTTLNSVRTKDMGEVGNMLSDLVVELKGFKYDEDEKNPQSAVHWCACICVLWRCSIGTVRQWGAD